RRRDLVRRRERLPAGRGARAGVRAPGVDEHIHGAGAGVRAPGGDQAMAATDGRAPARVALFQALGRAPWTFDFFHALRRIEGLFTDKPKLGRALRPGHEPARPSQDASPPSPPPPPPPS